MRSKKLASGLIIKTKICGHSRREHTGETPMPREDDKPLE